MALNASPVFSVVVPVFNVEKFLPKCIDSILAQDFIDWELLLIDDGSTDGSGAICDHYAQSDCRIKVFHTLNKGVSAARNLGLEKAVGVWSSFVDSDDYVDSDWLSVVKKEIDWYNADVYTWGNYYETEYGNEWQRRYVPERRTYESTTEFIGTGSYRHGCFWYMFRTEWIRRYRCQFPVGVKRSEDQCFLLQYFSHNPNIYSIYRPFYHYVKRRGSVCNISFSVDDVKDNLAAANHFAEYAKGFVNIDKKFVFNATTQLYRDFFHYVQLIDRLFDEHTQVVYRQYYKDIVRFFSDFKKDDFLRRANRSIKFSYQIEAFKQSSSKVFMALKLRINQIIHPFRVVEDMIRNEGQILSAKIENEHSVNQRNAAVFIVFDRLKNCAMSSVESGVTKDALCSHEVVVSLTTYSYRIHEVYLTIESIMQGTVKPNRIILWLAEDEFGGKELPVLLQRQMKRGLEVRYCEDLRSYKKIIPALALCPDACIVTIDDDLVYEPDLLEHLIASYRKHPDCVSACRTHKIKTDEDGMPLPYLQWDMLRHEGYPSYRNFLTSGGGTLFPAHSLHTQVVDKNFFMKLCPHGDDIWLNAMLMLNGVKVAKAFTHDINGDDYILNESQYVKSLWSINKEEDGNDPQIKAVWEHFKLHELFK